MKSLLPIVIAMALTACATSNKPVIDYKTMAPEKIASLEADTKECASLAKQASTDGVGMALLGALAGDHRQARALEEKERIIHSECLRGRGYAVVY